MLNWHLKLTDDFVIDQLNGRKIEQTKLYFLMWNIISLRMWVIWFSFLLSSNYCVIRHLGKTSNKCWRAMFSLLSHSGTLLEFLSWVLGPTSENLLYLSGTSIIKGIVFIIKCQTLPWLGSRTRKSKESFKVLYGNILNIQNNKKFGCCPALSRWNHWQARQVARKP